MLEALGLQPLNRANCSRSWKIMSSCGFLNMPPQNGRPFGKSNLDK